MHICLICVEIFAWGKYGGFGRATRMIGKELAKRGMDVTAIIPLRANQKKVEFLDGIRVLGYESWNLREFKRLVEEANADVYHSQEPSFGTYLAKQAKPDRRHVVTFRDPRDINDWWTEFRYPSLNRLQVVMNWLYEDNWMVKNAVQQSDGQYAAAKCLIKKSKIKYGLRDDPDFLPTPVIMPEKVEKAKRPTICFISRWDKRKRPELFFELVKKFPEFQFLAVGRSRNLRWDEYLRSEYENLPNLKLIGFINQFNNHQLFEILGSSWILVNTSAREGLPNVFIEAASHHCAILSSVDPDSFASKFGYHSSHDEFEEGLRILISNDQWREKAKAGYEYVKEVFAVDKSIQLHIGNYEQLFNHTRKIGGK